MGDQAWLDEELGRRERVFAHVDLGGKPPAERRRAAATRTAVVACGVFLIFGLVLLGRGSSLLFAGSVAGLGIGLIAWMWVHTSRLIKWETSNRVEVHANGLIDYLGKVPRVVFWEEVVEYRTSRDTATINGVTYSASTITLRREDGTDYARGIDGLVASGELVSLVSERVTEARLPGALETVRAGGTVVFGNLALDSRGVHHGGRTLTWEQAQSLVLHPRHVAIRDTHGEEWVSEPIDAIPNAHLFVTLAKQLPGEQSSH
ncbi:hypothetical protein FBY35_3751 [Streptomyces sp. SLBN-118]|uniref:DUF6585 family protein n=1 Tax=Streptomyces sp. SLBN-118 TaxID=2768454 RepID=UPI00116CE64C|nr:DUF6585 family protein [Streptomyces sp. SLBN-118]TQK42357.1 hypothetical protein FBY35_3751 [Streptomyces sp. SLBN-118]